MANTKIRCYHGEKLVLLTRDIDGLIFRTDIPGKIGGKLRAGKIYEAGMMQYIERLQINGDCVDIGCFIGTHSIYFAKKLNKRVYAFDVDQPQAFHDHVILNTAIEVHRFDVWLNPPLKLSDYTETKIGLIKIDVDGSDEIDVLNCCKSIIDRDRPHIFIEARTKEKLKEIENYLINYDNIEVFNATPTYYFKPKKNEV